MLSLLRDDYVMRDLGLGSCTWKRGVYLCCYEERGSGRYGDGGNNCNT